MAEIDYYELFGLKEEGEKEQEVAEPENEQEGMEGEKEQEVAEPAVDLESENENESDEGANAPSDDDRETGRDEGKGNEGEREKNALFAKMRREAEDAARKNVEKLIARLDIKGKDGEAIKTIDELSAAAQNSIKEKKTQTENELIEKLEFGGFSQGEIDEIIAAKSAKEELSQLKEQKRREDFERMVSEEISVIAEFEPDIKGISDLLKLPNYDAFLARVNAGESFLSAYMLTHKDRINRGKGDLRTARTNEPASKAHLTAGTKRSGAAVDLPDDIFAEYRRFNPNVTRAEAARHYQKSKSR